MSAVKRSAALTPSAPSREWATDQHGVIATGPVGKVRFLAYDAFRGIAVVLMIGDHLCAVFGGEPYRFTLGRLAMPMFFILAGHLARHVHWRHLWIGLVGEG